MVLGYFCHHYCFYFVWLFATSAPELGGTIGYELNLFLQDYIGKTGTLLTLLFGLIVYLIFKIKLSPEKYKRILILLKRFQIRIREVKTSCKST